MKATQDLSMCKVAEFLPPTAAVCSMTKKVKFINGRFRDEFNDLDVGRQISIMDLIQSIVSCLESQKEIERVQQAIERGEDEKTFKTFKLRLVSMKDLTFAIFERLAPQSEFKVDELRQVVDRYPSMVGEGVRLVN
jgi:hypothetical protein